MSGDDVKQFEDDQKTNTSKKPIIIIISAIVLIIFAGIGFKVFYFDRENQQQEYQIQGLDKNKNFKTTLLSGKFSKPDLLTNTGADVNKSKRDSQNEQNKIIKRLEDFKKQTETTTNSVGEVKNSLTALKEILSKESLKSEDRAKSIVEKSKLHQQQTEGFFKKIMTKFESFTSAQTKTTKKDKHKEKAPFDLVSVNLWDAVPQATIRFYGKLSIVDVGAIRVGWKVENIDFDKEQITVTKNGFITTLNKIR